ncbi:carboxypeptidase-like regulatory domain-containing protein [Pareuzebyella sediminis]|uniref:carboxypeptidase-like regulatory domain-containing protein n=1 Tax=Pareuzebyella sediminis TaxID=2607998 RepID=UPI0011ECCD7A|nr:carboxypeptidase-like regulatory domain-containing protein [Pareuzebyella sediminis]
MRNAIFLLILLCSLGLFSQNTGSIKGNIVDLEAAEEPLLFADVSLHNTSWKTKTNFNGNFELSDIPVGKYDLQISFLGYETRTVAVEIRAESSVRVEAGLQAKSLSLNEIDEDDKVLSKEMASIVSTEGGLP